MSTHAYKEYTKKLAHRLGRLSIAMCRLCGIEHAAPGQLIPGRRMGSQEDMNAVHDLFDAVQNKARAAELLDWLLQLAEKDFDNAIRESYGDT